MSLGKQKQDEAVRNQNQQAADQLRALVKEASDGQKQMGQARGCLEGSKESLGKVGQNVTQGLQALNTGQ